MGALHLEKPAAPALPVHKKEIMNTYKTGEDQDERSHFSNSKRVNRNGYRVDSDRYVRSRTVDGRINAERTRSDALDRSQLNDDGSNTDDTDTRVYRDGRSSERFNAKRYRVSSIPRMEGRRFPVDPNYEFTTENFRGDHPEANEWYYV